MHVCSIAPLSMPGILFLSTQYFFSFNISNYVDVSTILFLVAMYGAFYAVHFLIEKRLSPKALIGKDLIFLVLKFLIPLSYALIRQSIIKYEEERKIFLLNFLIYALILFVVDSIIYYQLINKNDGKSNR